MQTTAFYAGSFDPFTRGHADIVERSLALFDNVIIAIGINDSKQCLFTPEERVKQISCFYQEHPRIQVLAYDTLTVDIAAKMGASVLVRGVRSGADMELERTLADLNRHIARMETVILPASQQLSHISSSVVRELLRFGHDVTDFLPKGFDLNP
ncbi:MAG: pantetheine-phosphate adenylyltransferase [Porphyromonas sp.]|nr:pantetheine-phosphate adenylyltransferase [Porphyromonas sp.]